MTPWQNRTTGLTRRMADDMKLRNLSQSTIDAYTYHVGRFAEFFGKPVEQATPDTIQKTCKLAAAKAGIRKNVTPHTLRHSYATGLLEAGVDLLTIGRLLGHRSFMTTMIYLHVRRPHLERTPSPIDWLPVRQLPGWTQPDGNNASRDSHDR